MVSDVVCAIRGGPGSYQTRLAALQHAGTAGVGIRFVSVVNPTIYEALHEGEQDAIRSEMAWRDLALAKATAAQAGLDDVRFTVAVRVGGLADTIAAYALEVAAGSILIGSPRPAADATFGADAVGSFVEDLRQKTGLEVLVMAPPYGAPPTR